MAEAIAPPAAPSTPSVALPASLPVGAVLPWAFFVGILALVALYFVGAEQGALSVFAGSDVHEWVHDGRHLLGFPCH
ncbi:CbtB domain-containing protein [Streptomyces vilmorinianum]|uniref:CbtB domain-containing protein n=1 Tax=Streptomyces vilmorinianum TaxID=3051092 RepID=UPI0010FB0888|nr:CbtB-domain containing protein [Streptomyces vilmorinianum]